MMYSYDMGAVEDPASSTIGRASPRREGEAQAAPDSAVPLCGIDEVGRGALAGPVCAGAVILSAQHPIEGLRDSKAMTPQARERAAALIMEYAFGWAVGWASPSEIDLLNIRQATLLAMARALRHITEPPNGYVHPSLEVCIDGRDIPRVTLSSPCTFRAIVRGDQHVAQIQAASILAKTHRDYWMSAHSAHEPRYHFHQHKGYPTALHRACIAHHGASSIQRNSFKITVNLL